MQDAAEETPLACQSVETSCLQKQDVGWMLILSACPFHVCVGVIASCACVQVDTYMYEERSPGFVCDDGHVLEVGLPFLGFEPPLARRRP